MIFNCKEFETRIMQLFIFMSQWFNKTMLWREKRRRYLQRRERKGESPEEGPYDRRL